MGEHINGYEVLRHLRDGTFGRVLLVSKADREYALKLVLEQYVLSAKVEATIVRALSHRNVVRLVDEFAHKEYYCLVFEHLSCSLLDVLDLKGPLSAVEVRPLMQELLVGVAYVHGMGLTHTDLKPENVMLDQRGVVLIDFGSAVWDHQTHFHLINTRQYRAPEVILKAGQWGHASDMWSIGCIMYELMTGQLLFDGNDFEQLWLIEQTCG
jgi:serine/threonine protein kinase